MEGGGVVVAVSLDIKNAFNTLPWESVEEAMDYHHFLPYLVEIIRGYFRDRQLEFRDKTGLWRRRGAFCGIPQGSVLDPLLWDLALRSALSPDCRIVCYANDTIILSGGNS